MYFFEIFSKLKYFGNILNMLQEGSFSYNISKIEKTSFSDVNRNLKFHVSNQTSLIKPVWFKTRIFLMRLK